MAEENIDLPIDQLNEHEELETNSEQEAEFIGSEEEEEGRGTDLEEEADEPITTTGDELEHEQQTDDEEDGDHNLPEKCKRFKKGSPDWISNLPDSILLHILSFLPMKEVVSTGILSKKWRFLWTSATTLDFNYKGCSSEYHIREFITFVDKTLVRSSAPHVQKMVIEFPYRPHFVHDVSGWMQFASQHSVNELELKFRPSNLDDQYDLPQSVYENSSLRKLSLSSCKFSPSFDLRWNHLSILNLEYIALDEELVKKILSSCPELDSLELSICCGVVHFVIESTSLRKFVLKGYWDKSNEQDDSHLDISAPNIKSLEISGFVHRKMVVIRSVPSLVDAKLDFYRTVSDDERSHLYRTNRYMLIDLLGSLQHVGNLTIGSWCIQVLSIMAHRALTLPRYFNCKCLTLNAQMRKWDIPGTELLLQISPDLDTLVIDMSSHYNEFLFDAKFLDAYDFEEKNYLASAFRYILPMKLIKICGFWEGDTENTIQVAQAMLKNALTLQKLVIDALKEHPVSGSRHPQEALQVAQKLLSFPRSSRDAIVVL